MYKCGYCSLVVHEDLSVAAQLAEDMKQHCERAVLGIPDELTYARLFGDFPYSASERKERLLAETAVDEVIILNGQETYQELYQSIFFDSLYIGSCFGREYEKTVAFANEKGIDLISMLPAYRVENGEIDALKIALANCHPGQKIVLFGTGSYFDTYMSVYGKRFPPVYAVDNNSAKWGTSKQGIQIFSPDKLKDRSDDDILVVICAEKYQEMVAQLSMMGCYDYRLMLYSNLIALLEEYTLVRRGELEYLEHAHQILAKMLKEFDRVCQKHQLHYYMICGSLIGVLRHGGFIPWDDDVDVAMPRADFKKLQKIVKEEWSLSKYQLLNYDDFGNGAFLDCMPRIIDMEEKLPMKVYDKVKGRARAEVIDRPFLDIYVMDNAFDNDRRHLMIMNMMRGIYNLMMGHRGLVDYDEYRTRMPENTIRQMKMLHWVGRHLPLRFLTHWYDHLSEKANHRECENYFMNSCAITCIERKFKQDFFREGIRKKFLDFEVTVPSDADGLMEAMNYHNYMQFPRMSIRKPSHYYNSDIIIW